MENIQQNITQSTTPSMPQSTAPVFKPNVNREDSVGSFIRKQNIKTKINQLGCQVGVDFYPRFNEFLESMIVKAIFRTKCNRRKTVRGMDI
jgi:hypothetical protein